MGDRRKSCGHLMNKTESVEVADIFRQYGAYYRKMHRGEMPLNQLRVMRAIEICRTSQLGGHVEQCDTCRFSQSLLFFKELRHLNGDFFSEVAQSFQLDQRLCSLHFYGILFLALIPSCLGIISVKNLNLK